jgi:hypothetical protein
MLVANQWLNDECLIDQAVQTEIHNESIQNSNVYSFILLAALEQAALCSQVFCRAQMVARHAAYIMLACHDGMLDLVCTPWLRCQLRNNQ